VAGQGPPEGVDPAALFRRLCEAPRARRPLGFRLPGAEHLAIEVRALRPGEEAEALASRGDVAAELAARALWTPAGRAARSAAELGELGELEHRALVSEVLVALAEVSPSYGRSDTTAWMRALREGAAHPSNFSIAYALGSSIDSGFSRNTPRPDRYFGMPPNSWPK
jgi:hypothetical protein